MDVIKEEIHAIVSALVGGARYGIKIRAPHALVMTMLFRHDTTTKEKLLAIFKLTRQHATNLAAFCTIYKSVLAVLKFASRQLNQHQHDSSTNSKCIWQSIGRTIALWIVDGPNYHRQQITSSPTSSRPAPGYPERHRHALIAGAVGGYFVWGRYSNVNYQIVLYLASRVLVGMGKRYFTVHDNKNDTASSSSSSSRTYSLFAAAVWGIVMMLWEESPHVLQPSLRKSMDEIYRYQLQSTNSNKSMSINNGTGNDRSRHSIATAL